MAVKLSSRQQAQLAFLEPVAAKLSRVNNLIEQMGAGPVDEQLVRGLGRMLNEIKSGAGGLGLSGLADSAGLMATTARRGGSVPMKVRSLRESLVVLRINYDQAVSKASTPDTGEDEEP